MSLFAAPPTFDGPPPRRPLVLEQDFVGTLACEGTLTPALPLRATRFSVAMTGDWDGRVLTLQEDFIFGDGSRDRKTWRFEKIASGRYRATREDVVGFADALQDGPALRLDYLVRLGPLVARFQDLIYWVGDGVIADRAHVSKFGLGIARAEIVMRPQRAANAADAEPPALAGLARAR